MTITDAIAMLKEWQSRGDVDVEVALPVLRCATHHRDLPCPYCDLCEHGKMLTQHCPECTTACDRSWMLTPLSDAEIDQVERYFDGQRYGPLRERHMPRVYVDYHVKLGPLVTGELRRLRRERRQASDAVDPQASNQGTPTTRDDASSSNGTPPAEAPR